MRAINLTGGIPYREALSPEQWDEMKLFLRVILVAGKMSKEKGRVSQIIRAWHYKGGIDIEEEAQ